MSSENPIWDIEEISHERLATADGLEAHQFVLRIPAQLEYFKGHFDGFAVLAAAVQLDLLILPRVERLFPDLGPVQKATKMKFRAPIRPGDEITLRLETTAKGRIAFSLSRGNVACAQGLLAPERGPPFRAPPHSGGGTGGPHG